MAELLAMMATTAGAEAAIPAGMAQAGGMASGVGTAGAVGSIPILTKLAAASPSMSQLATGTTLVSGMLGGGGSAPPQAMPLGGGGGGEMRNRQPTFANIPKHLVIQTQPSHVVSRKPEQLEAILAMLMRGGMV